MRLLALDGYCAFRHSLGTDSASLGRLVDGADPTQFPPVHSAEHNRSLFWGTYRPHLLAGVRSRQPRSLLVGIAWYDETGQLPVRHTAEDGDDLLFRWDVHDGRFYGRQTIVDRRYGLDMTVRFVKTSDGAGWALRVDGKRAVNFPLRFVVYFISELGAKTEGGRLSLRSATDALALNPDTLVPGDGFSPDPSLHVTGALDEAGDRKFRAVVSDLHGSWQEGPWTASRTTRDPTSAFNLDVRHGGQKFTEGGQPRRGAKAFAGYNAIRLEKRLSGNIRVEVSLAELPTAGSDEPFVDPFADPCATGQAMQRREALFHQRFNAAFDWDTEVADLARFAAQATPDVLDRPMPPASTLRLMASSGLSNLLGGIGFWHGEYWVDEADREHEEAEGLRNPRENTRRPSAHGPLTLFSGVPSRAKFPRGFLWDEGFHQLLVAVWDAALSKDVVLHWLGCMDPATGWIPREQILGGEPRTRVPEQFVAQHRTHTNPPAMVLQIQRFAQAAVNAGGDDDGFLQKALPPLEKWVAYLLRSQCGGSRDCHVKPLAASQQSNASYLFRWRSRNGYHLLASGLDDYPRPVCRYPWNELHLDLTCWAGMMVRTVDTIRAATHATTGVSGTANDAPLLPEFGAHLSEIFWDPANRRFADVTGCTNNRTSPKYHSQFVGYVSLFPMLTMVLDDAEKAAAIVRMADRELLGQYGLQSLSNASRKKLGKHDDYWTGPIWVNLNYLMLRALKLKYITLVGPEAQRLYDKLRARLVQNIGSEFVRTGKLWENYDYATGRGRGTAPFTGWTTLVLAAIAEHF